MHWWVLMYEAMQYAREHAERWEAYRAARATADAARLPLLNIGCPRIVPGKYPCGDVCLDLSAKRLAWCKSPSPTHGDVRAIPYPTGYFGAVLCAHVLEHLATVADAQQACAEMVRVAGGRVFLISPSRASIVAWLHPEHKLWVERVSNGQVKITQR